MPTQTDSILQLAAERGAAKQLSYQGELTPAEVYALLQAAPYIKLVDVRTLAELELVGRVPDATHLEWASYPGMQANPHFAAQLLQTLDKQDTIVFMCRTGGRSHNAAIVAESLGFQQVYNMLEGFEGAANAQRQRCTINGWKVANLPWHN